MFARNFRNPRAAEPELDVKSLAFLGIPAPPDAARRRIPVGRTSPSRRRTSPLQDTPSPDLRCQRPSPPIKVLKKKMPEFIELSRKYDPQGKFRNEFLNKNIFGS
jgi:hypothetical protein